MNVLITFAFLVCFKAEKSFERNVHSSCTKLPGNPWDLRCFVTRPRLDLTCIWKKESTLPTMNYTLTAAWKNRKSYRVSTTNTSITINRRQLYFKEEVAVGLHANTTADKSCLETEEITFFPNYAVKCDSPSKIKYERSSGGLSIWCESTEPVDYELKYKEIISECEVSQDESCKWKMERHKGNKRCHMTVEGLNPASSYLVQLRCIPDNTSCFVCHWSDEIIIHPELRDAPKVSYSINTLDPGKRSIFIQVAQEKHADGWNATVLRLPKVEGVNPKMEYEINHSELYLVLSEAAFLISIYAYNKEGRSPSANITIPALHQKGSQKQLDVQSLKDRIIISWNPSGHKSFCCYIIDWGPVTGEDVYDMKTAKLSTNCYNYTLEGTFLAGQRYRVMLHERAPCNQLKLNDTEWTYLTSDVYAEEQVPRVSPLNVSVHHVMKHTAVVEWMEIPQDDRQGFLKGYKIYYTNSLTNVTEDFTVDHTVRKHQLTGLGRNTAYIIEIAGITKAGAGVRSLPIFLTTLEYATGELEGIIAGVCFGIVFVVVVIGRGFSFLYKRTKKVFWPNIPNPGNSNAIQAIKITAVVDNMETLPNSLYKEDYSHDSLTFHVIEDDSKDLTKMESVNLMNKESKCSQEDSEMTDCGNNLETREGIPATIKDLDSILHTKTDPPPVSDYTTMEFIQKVMPSILMRRPNVSQSDTENESSLYHSSQDPLNDLLLKDYIKQAQLVNIVPELSKTYFPQGSLRLTSPRHHATLDSMNNLPDQAMSDAAFVDSIEEKEVLLC